MSATVLYMSMSLDGFIAGPNERPDNGLGDGGHRLHEWVLPVAAPTASELARSAGVNGQVVDEFMATGAVVAGRGTFEPAGGWGGDHHDGVPIFVLSRREPGIDVEQWPLVTYVDDVATAMAEAKRAAGDRNVLVHGAGDRAARARRRRPRRARDPPHPGAPRPGAPPLRQPRSRAHRARAHPDPRGRGRRHPPALPRPALSPRRPGAE